MAGYEYRTMTNVDLTEFANQVKDLIADNLGLPELDNYAIIMIKKGLLGRAWDYIFEKDPKSHHITIVKTFNKKEDESNTSETAKE